MRKLLLLVGALLAAHLVLLFVRPSGAGAEAAPSAGTLDVGVVFDVGGRGDKSFNDGAFAGATRAQRALGARVRYIEPGEGSDREAGLRLLAAEDMDLVVGVGFIFSDDLTQLAREYPRARFAGVDYALATDSLGRTLPPPPNLLALKFREEEGSFLVGALAALVGGSKRVGFVGGMDIPLIHKFEAGYRAGVKHVCPDCEVVAQYAGVTPEAFKNPGRGKELALSQYRSGVNVIFHASGSTGLGVFEAARATGKKAIGVDADQYDEAPGYVLTSMVKRVDEAVYDAVETVKAGEFRGGVRVLGLKERGVDYVYDARNRHLIPDWAHARVEALRDSIIAGDIRVPATRFPAVRMHAIAKAFGPVAANRDASLEAGRGEVHALVGENGAGKSTLMRVLSGMHAPDAGTVEVADARTGALRDVTGWSTAEAIAAGVGMVHQHFMLVPTLTVAENVVLGMERTRGPGGVALDRAGAEQAVGELAGRAGLRVDPRRRVADLSVGEAQRVEILKVLYRGARILVLDEPTAVLSPPEVRELWGVLRGVAEGGGTVVLITHKLDEVVEVSEAITVMRAGRTVARLRTADTTPREVARAMVGREVELALDHVGNRESGIGNRDDASALLGAAAVADAAPAGPSAPPFPIPDSRLPALSVRSLVVPAPRRPRAVDGVSFDLAPGEILGVAGVEGNGQTELVEAIAGLAPAASGRVLLAGRDVTALGVRARADAGLSHIPEDRHRRGLVLDYPVADNLVLGLQHRYARGGLSKLLGGRLDRARVDADARRLVRDFDIRPADPALPARALSGGNQQKVVIAREMTGRDYHVLLAAQPTRGVDVGAIEFIHDQLRQARAAGKGVLLVSADLAEVLALADRVAVMYEGRLAAVLPRAAATLERLGPLMTGAEQVPNGAAA